MGRRVSDAGSFAIGCVAVAAGFVASIFVAGPLMGLVERLTGQNADWVTLVLLIFLPFAGLVAALKWMGRGGRSSPAARAMAQLREWSAGCTTVTTIIIIVAGVVVLLSGLGQWTLIVACVVVIAAGALVVWWFATQRDQG